MLKKLILGTAQFGMDYGINNSTGKIQKSEVFEILKYAFQNGIELLDTAPVYGDAHKIIGQFHKEHEQIRYKVITKIPANFPIYKLEELVDGFLLELNIDSIEVLHFHSIIDYVTCEKQMISEVFNRLKRSKKVKSFGVSIYENSEADLLNRDLIDVVQLPFNLLDNLNQRGELIYQLKQKEYEIHTRSVFLQGLFFKNAIDSPVKELIPYLLKIEKILQEPPSSKQALALQYCLTQEKIDHVLIGVDSLAQLKVNLEHSRSHLREILIQQIDQIQVVNCEQLNPVNWKK